MSMIEVLQLRYTHPAVLNIVQFGNMSTPNCSEKVYLSDIFERIKECEEGFPIDKLLNGSVCHSGFRRLN
jgi:hypothetical protein